MEINMDNSRYKYPRTYHLLFSPGTTVDDKFVASHAHFEGKEVVVTEKLDGENTTIYPDFFHARSTSSLMHPSRTYVGALHGQIGHNIPDGFRICGENVYAKHSIAYSQLEAFFIAFSIWKGDECLSWDDTLEWCKLLEVPTVPELYRGIWDEQKIKTIYDPHRKPDAMEGYVVRLASSFKYDDFATSVSKYVRKNHVQSSEHWMNEVLTPNSLKEKQE